MDGGFLMNDLYNDVTMMGIRKIFDHMILRDCYKAGLMSEDEWKLYLKQLINISTKEEVKCEQRKTDTEI